MYWTYLRRELVGRKKQTIVVAAGLAIAIALVIVVNALSAGVRDAQAQALESVYGVGTDLTVTGAAVAPGEGRAQTFDFEQDAGETGDDGTTSLSQSRLVAEPMRSTLDASVVETVEDVDGVSAATSALSLTNMTFSGELPPRPEEGTDQTQIQQAPPQEGGQGSFGGGSFGVDSFSVLGIDPESTGVGPLSAVELTQGRALAATDTGKAVAVVDSAYATTAEVAVGDTVDVGGTEVEVVGIVASTSSEADTAADVYLPLDVAQEIAGLGNVVSTVYVQAESAESIGAVQASLEEALPDATVSSQSDLAATVSGSLSSAAALISNLGTWLSLTVLGVALALAVLFTISGVSRRTREFGTLKAIGWSNGRVVGQVAGESLTQGLIGGAAGLVIGLAGIGIVNAISPTISTAPAAPIMQGGPGGMTQQAGGPALAGGLFDQGTTEVVLSAPLTPWIVVAAVGLAIAGGLVAGAFGGWRAARLSPAEALRSVG